MVQLTVDNLIKEMPQLLEVNTDTNKTNYKTIAWIVDGKGDLRIVNTGGSSASEGGAGSSSTSEVEKGDLSSGEKSDEERIPDDDGWDPIKRSVEKRTRKER